MEVLTGKIDSAVEIRQGYRNKSILFWNRGKGNKKGSGDSRKIKIYSLSPKPERYPDNE
jgi:hypothetical protein